MDIVHLSLFPGGYLALNAVFCLIERPVFQANSHLLALMTEIILEKDCYH